MESLSETLWDAIICGTDVPQSLLALALSRSGKNVLHIDPNEYYGGSDAALTLQEAEEWVAKHQIATAAVDGSRFTSASIQRPEAGDGNAGSLSSSRAYSLALSPHVVHARSALLSQLVSSRAYRQLDFLAVGSIYIFSAPAEEGGPTPPLTRIPSTREDVFSTSAIPARAKRSLMKFLKFVLDYEAPEQRELWEPHADEPLAELLRTAFKMDPELQTYVLALTFSLSGDVSAKDGLAMIYRHLTSMGVFGPGFAAVYPKWGGSSEIAQVACRAGAVGGGIYILGTGLKDVRGDPASGEPLEVQLSNDVVVKTKLLVRGQAAAEEGSEKISRLVAVVGSPLKSLFEIQVEGAPSPAVAVIVLPKGSVKAADTESTYPIYLLVHSSDTGECPTGQCTIYLTSKHTGEHSKAILESALTSVLAAIGEDTPPQSLYQLYYEQSYGPSKNHVNGTILELASAPLGLTFDDSLLDSVREAWQAVAGPDAASAEVEEEYMNFPDRPGAGDEDDVYD